MRVARAIELGSVERSELQRLARSATTSVRLARRAKIVLLAADGWENQEIAAEVGVGRVQVSRWRDRYAEGGLAAIEQDLPRGGRPAEIDAAEIVRRTTQTAPRNATHWSTRSLARELGVSDTTVLRVWRQHGLKPHRIEGFKVSRDPRFVEKLTDIVGLYLDPPEHALVLCCDEKSQVQALDRTQPGLPMKPGRAIMNGSPFCARSIARHRVESSCTWSWITTAPTNMPGYAAGSRAILVFMSTSPRHRPLG
jgi:transposase